jgi:hypothetical protein
MDKELNSWPESVKFLEEGIKRQALEHSPWWWFFGYHAKNLGHRGKNKLDYIALKSFLHRKENK